MDLNFIIIPLAVLQTGYAIIGFHLDRRASIRSDPTAIRNSRVRPSVMFGFTFLTWSALAFDYIDRHYLEPQLPDASFVFYGGLAPDVLTASVSFRNWGDFRKDKALLITRVSFSDKDRMTDEWLAKSTLYTISEPNIVLSVIISKGKMRFAANAPNTIEYDFAVVPADTNLNSISSLSDVERLGGKILIVSAQAGITGSPNNPNNGKI